MLTVVVLEGSKFSASQLIQNVSITMSLQIDILPCWPLCLRRLWYLSWQLFRSCLCSVLHRIEISYPDDAGSHDVPANWQREYYGYLMASQESHDHPSSDVCVDNTPEFLPHSSPLYGAGLAFVIADCDTPATLDECDSGEYVHNRQITCVVCYR